jgi:hypothetical protein
MIVLAQHVADGLLEIGEIDNHAVPGFALDGDFDLVGMTVQTTALGMTG